MKNLKQNTRPPMSNTPDTNQASEVLQGDCLELMKDIPDGSTRHKGAVMSKIDLLKALEEV